MPLVLISVSAWTCSPLLFPVDQLFQRLLQELLSLQSWTSHGEDWTSRNFTGPKLGSVVYPDQLTGQGGRLWGNMGSLGISCVEGVYRADRAVSVCCFHKGQTTPWTARPKCLGDGTSVYVDGSSAPWPPASHSQSGGTACYWLLYLLCSSILLCWLRRSSPL